MSANDVNLAIDARTSALLSPVSAPELLGLEQVDVVEAPHLPTISPVDVQAVHLLLEGGSVVDWRRLGYRDVSEVRSFLAINGFDLDNATETARLVDLHRRAVIYVADTFDIEMPDRVASPGDVCDLFLFASGSERALQRAACVVLKVMHVINHLESRRLIHHMSVSEVALFEAASGKVQTFIERMKAEGLGVVSYEPSRKTDHSLVTKLLSKPRVTAAQIFDKLRFRLVVAERADLVPVMLWLLQRLFPFNHVIAGESHNTILSPDEVREALDARTVTPLAPWLDPEADRGAPLNPATSPRFRMVNFVAELPLRVRRFCSIEERRRFRHLGHLVLVTLEFQLFDEATADTNERGDGNHAAYKRRQLELVGRRLWGAGPPPIKGLATQS